MTGFLYMLVMGAIGVNHLAWSQPPYEVDQETEAMIKNCEYLCALEKRPNNKVDEQWFI